MLLHGPKSLFLSFAVHMSATPRSVTLWCPKPFRGPLSTHTQATFSAIRAIEVRQRTDNLVIGICERKRAGERRARWHGLLHVSEERVGGMCTGCIGR